jgi:hypothetical protein
MISILVQNYCVGITVKVVSLKRDYVLVSDDTSSCSTRVVTVISFQIFCLIYRELHYSQKLTLMLHSYQANYYSTT